MLQFEPIKDDTEVGKVLHSKFTCSFRSGYVRCKGVCMPQYYVDFAEQIVNMDVRDDDIWVCSFPKTGTTWTQEMVWCIGNDLDFEAAKAILPERFPFLELTPLFDYRSAEVDTPEFESNSITHIEDLPSPRYIKAHLPFKLLPRKLQNGSTKAKIIYVTRNPKDTCVSYYHHCQLLEGYRGSFDEFYKLFLNDMVCFAPYWDHVLDFWEVAKANKNVLFIKYEDMKKDLGNIIEKVSHHLNKSLNIEQIEQLKEHLSFESMKNNPATNYEFAIDFNKVNKLIEDNFCSGKFMRSGKVGEWKKLMTPEISEIFDKWTKEKLSEIEFAF